MLAVFFCLFGIAYLLSHLSSKMLRLAAMVSVVLFIILGGRNLIRYSQAYVFENHNQNQKYGPAIKWLNQNTPPDSVVYADEQISQLISVYTANNVFYARYANLFLMPDSEVLDRFMINNYFGKIDNDFVIENVRSIYGVRYIDRYGHAVQGNKLRRLIGFKPVPEVYLPEEAINRFLNRAHQLQSYKFTDLIRSYRLDYFIFEKNDPAWMKFDRLSIARRVYETKDFVVYQYDI